MKKAIDYNDIHPVIDLPEGVEIKLPHSYDLVNLYLKDGNRISGWFTGSSWDGYRMRPGMVVVGWQRRFNSN